MRGTFIPTFKPDLLVTNDRQNGCTIKSEKKIAVRQVNDLTAVNSFGIYRAWTIL